MSTYAIEFNCKVSGAQNVERIFTTGDHGEFSRVFLSYSIPKKRLGSGWKPILHGSGKVFHIANRQHPWRK